MKLLCMFGGVSPEHDVSCVSAASVISNIDQSKYEIKAVGITKTGKWLWVEPDPELIKSRKWEEQDLPKVSFIPEKGINGGFGINGSFYRPDVVFPVLHGENGEDGKVQAMLMMAGIDFVGCGTTSAAITMDKIFTHQVCCAAGGIEMADYIYTTAKEINSSLDTVMEKIKAKFDYPVFVKPANTGSSVGVTKAHNDEDLAEALKLAAQFDRRILIEEFIDGYELETAVLGNDDPIVSCVGRILPSREFYSYESKYEDGTSGLIIDAPLPEGKTEELRSTAARIYQLFDCKGLSRVDFFMRKSDNAIIFNEINTIPGFTDISMYPKLFGECGIPYSQLIERLIDYAQEKGIR